MERERDMATCTSNDFRTCTGHVSISHSDTRLEHLYTNGILLSTRMDRPQQLACLGNHRNRPGGTLSLLDRTPSAPSNRRRRGVIRKDKFVSLQSAGEVGDVLTRPLQLTGGSLEVNYATDATGWIRIKLCHLDGTAISEVTLYNSEALFRNELEHRVSWKCGSLSELGKQPVRLRIRMENADIYSLRFFNAS